MIVSCIGTGVLTSARGPLCDVSVMKDPTKDELRSCGVSSGMLYLLGVAGSGAACEISGLPVVDVTGVELLVVLVWGILGREIVFCIGTVVVISAW